MCIIPALYSIISLAQVVRHPVPIRLSMASVYEAIKQVGCVKFKSVSRRGVSTVHPPARLLLQGEALKDEPERL